MTEKKDRRRLRVNRNGASHKKEGAAPSVLKDDRSPDMDISGRNAMLRAVARGDVEDFEGHFKSCNGSSTAVNYKDYSQRTALMQACLAGSFDSTRVSINNQLVKLDYQDISGFTALMHAAQRGHHLIVDLLLKKKANHQLVDSRGNTAIILAARRNHVDCLKAFAKYVNDPADWVVKGEYGLTAEQWAQTNQRLEALALIRNTLVESREIQRRLRCE